MSKLRLSEPEIIIACQFCASYSLYDEPYEEIKEGDVIVLWTQIEEEDSSISKPELRLTAVKPGKHLLDEVTQDLPNKLFEATVLRSTDKLVKSGQKVFGVIFPDFAGLVDSGPRSGYTNRRISAAIALFGGERKAEAS